MVTMMVEITTGGHASPRPPTCYVLLLLMSLCCFAEKTTAAAATSSALRRRARPWEGAHRRRRLFLLRSSATRSSLITILLLQPVFFLRPWARRKLKTGTGTVVIGQRLSGDAWRRTKEHGGTRDSSTSFLDKLKLDSEGDCSFKPEISRGAEISQDFFFGGRFF